MTASRYPLSPVAMLNAFREHRLLLWHLTRRDITSRYRGSVMGVLWSFLVPLLMLAVYGFVFGVVFQARWGQGTGAKGEFALYLFAGLMLHGFLAECLNRAPTLILTQPQYVKKVVFPLEILPLTLLGSALFNLLICWAILCAAILLVLGSLPLTALLVPFALIPFALLMLAASWALASLGVYLRDLALGIGLVTTVLLFISPVFYALDTIPMPWRLAYYLNPLTIPVEMVRALMIQGVMPDASLLVGYAAVSILSAMIGFALFQRIRHGFADVL